MEIKKSQFPIKGHVSPSDDQGGAEGIENLSFASSNGSILSIDKDPDNPMGFIVNATGLGTASISAKADADLSAGVNDLEDAIEITVIADEATKLNMVLDIAKDIPPVEVPPVS